MRRRSLCEGTAANGEQFGFTSAIYFEVNVSEEYRLFIDRYIQYISIIRSQYSVFRYAIIIVVKWCIDNRLYGYLTTNYLRQIHLWRYYSDRRFRFCLLNVRLLFARVQSRWKELTNNISATCEQRSRLCSWSGCFVILAIHRLTWSIPRQSNRYNNNNLSLTWFVCAYDTALWTLRSVEF